ncbi:hypothetical protein NEK97_08050 [Paenarthrobacter sp. UW852]|uniref:hypothetical protein n=1 Tax=Paenarthrobacter sp. UW852 TaxID=2951989 RepID=UPI0021479471|nr:hypothetical protein [Paenarthrobacter sp. UW852]MCR1161406.1 hypothetical protein [Paenarthrobacter sp. UW852]
MPRRPFRPGALSRRAFAARRHSRLPEHLQVCADCRAAAGRERQYLERLRGAGVPEASQDLAARLIQHTERLASEPAQDPWNQPQQGGLSRGLRFAAVAAGTLVVSAGALGVAAYVVAGDDQPRVLAGAGNAGALVGAWSAGPVDVMDPSFKAGSTMSLSASQLDALRDQGWACPELLEMGFHVVSAQASMLNGHPAVEIRLESNGHYATITEEHLPADAQFAGQRGAAQLSVTQGTPWKAVYAMPAAVISYTSDLPPESADDAVPEIVRAGDSMSHQGHGDGSGSWYGRLLRGLQTLLRPAGL